MVSLSLFLFFFCRNVYTRLTDATLHSCDLERPFLLSAFNWKYRNEFCNGNASRITDVLFSRDFSIPRSGAHQLFLPIFFFTRWYGVLRSTLFPPVELSLLETMNPTQCYDDRSGIEWHRWTFFIMFFPLLRYRLFRGHNSNFRRIWPSLHCSSSINDSYVTTQPWIRNSEMQNY